MTSSKDSRNLESILTQLHESLAQDLLDKVMSGEAKASDLNVARQFLKDNGIDGVPTEGNPLENLTHMLPSFEDYELPLQ